MRRNSRTATHFKVLLMIAVTLASITILTGCTGNGQWTGPRGGGTFSNQRSGGTGWGSWTGPSGSGTFNSERTGGTGHGTWTGPRGTGTTESQRSGDGGTGTWTGPNGGNGGWEWRVER